MPGINKKWTAGELLDEVHNTLLSMEHNGEKVRGTRALIESAKKQLEAGDTRRAWSNTDKAARNLQEYLEKNGSGDDLALEDAIGLLGEAARLIHESY